MLRTFTNFGVSTPFAPTGTNPQPSRNFPSLHPLPPAPVLNIAHRGAASLAPENTLVAAEKALAVGADMWEVDVATTLDNQLVLLHDDSLARTSNVAQIYPDRRPWHVQAFTLAELRGLDFGSWFNQSDPFQQIENGLVSPTDQAAYGRQGVTTLEQALQFTRDSGWRINVEIKEMFFTPSASNIVERVVTLIRKLNMVKQVIISSFNQHYLVRAKAADARIATGVLVTHPVDNPLALLRRLDAQAYHAPHSAINPAVVEGLRRHDLAVNVWTVNEPQLMQNLLQLGVTGLITDYPQTLDKLLSQSAAIPAQTESVAA